MEHPITTGTAWPARWVSEQEEENVTEERVESPQLREYRQQARAWLADNMPRGGGRDAQDDDPSPERLAEVKAL